MIKVDRATVPPPAILTDPKRAGARETVRAIDFYVHQKGKKAPTFLAYKLPAVKQALEQIFQKKCAYCESSYQAVMSFAVEHWRPKGRVTLDDGTRIPRGYFWLAASWNNLLVSCNECNGERKQREALNDTERKMGKLDRFPLVDETKRATVPGAEKDEEPLLVDPCNEDPSLYLEFFDTDKERAVLRPKADSPKGARSIEIYALNRLGLVRERQKVLAQITLRKSDLDQDLALLDTGLTAVQELIVTSRIKRTMFELIQMRALSTPYAALARRDVDDFLKPLLLRFGLPPLP